MRTNALRLFCPFLLAIPGVGAAVADAPEVRYDETKELIALVREATQVVAEHGVESACRAFREAGSRWFHDDVYVFVLEMDGEAVCHPARPGLEGRNLIEIRDPKGKPIVAKFVRELESSDEGWVHYQWPRPGSDLFRWKTSHVRRVAAGDGEVYVVGSGRYGMPMERFFVMEQVDDAVELIREMGEEAFPVLRDDAAGFTFYDAYVFVVDDDGTLLVNNAFPANEGADVSELEDIDGRRFVREMLRVPPGGSAWVHYKWPRPGDERPSAKSSYVRRVGWQGRSLVVGSGVYFEREPEVRHLGPASDVDATAGSREPEQEGPEPEAEEPPASVRAASQRAGR